MVFCSCVLITANANAFKTATHVASANEVRDEIKDAITSGSNPDTLLFKAGNMSVELRITSKRAYHAVIDYPEAFRAGAIGPDGFPDVITGQLLMHDDQTEIIGQKAAEIAGRLWEKTALHEPFEHRPRPSNFRSIDFAMGMLRYWSEHESSASWNADQSLAFIMGYFLHTVGDGFSHTWVNSYTGSAWVLSQGTGIFGTATEELQHISVESLVDILVPSYMLSTLPKDADGFELDRMKISIPVNFLDDFYSSVPPSLPEPGYDLEFYEYMNTFQDFDMFYGGPLYSYYNSQFYVSTAIRKWTKLGKMFDIAEDIGDSEPGKFLIALNNLPDGLVNEIAEFLAIDPFSKLLTNFMTCGLSDGPSVGNIIPQSELLRLLEYLSKINGRLDTYTEKAKVIRKNWLRLNECTAENISKTIGPDYNRDRPHINTDACADIVRAGWLDESSGGLFRGNIRPGLKSNNEFLINLKAAFLGGSADELYGSVTYPAKGNAPFSKIKTLEYNNGHRSVKENIERLYSYLKNDGFVFAEIAHVLFPSEDEPFFNNGKWDEMCTTVRDGYFEKCLNVHLSALASAAREARCVWMETKCLPQCIKKKCHELASKKWAYALCITGTHPTYSPQAFAHCTGKCLIDSVNCHIKSFTENFKSHNYAKKILRPIREVCDAVDDVREFIDCIRGVDVSFDDQVECVVDLCEESASVAGSDPEKCQNIYSAVNMYNKVKNVLKMFDNISPYYMVNLTFIEEDMAQNASYANAVQAWIDNERSKVLANPSDPDYDDKLHILDSYQIVHDEAETPGSHSLSDLDAAHKDIADNAARLGLIPVIYGPTVQAVLKDIGPDFDYTFTPFYNVVQGGKLAPINSQNDLENLFTSYDVDTNKLPWNNTSGSYSEICQDDSYMSIYCDSIASLDDPNAMNIDDKLLGPWPGEDWATGRGVVAWNEYDPTGVVPWNILTAFPLASTQDAYNTLYENIFRTPTAKPSFAGFEDPDSMWGESLSNVHIDNTEASEGGGSTRVDGCGYFNLNSPRHDTTEWQRIGTILQFDIKQKPSSNKWAWNTIQMYATIPEAGMYNVPLSSGNPINLASLPFDKWVTVEFTVPDSVKEAYLDDYSHATFNIVLSRGTCDAPIYLDNMRWAGDVEDRYLFHQIDSELYTVSTNNVLSFDDVNDWTAGLLLYQTDERTQGSGAIEFDLESWVEVESRQFLISSIFAPSKEINIDIALPKPQGTNHWFGEMQLFWECDSMNRTYIGQHKFIDVFEGEYNSVHFNVPDELWDILENPSHGEKCRVFIDITGTPSGIVKLDNMGFI